MDHLPKLSPKLNQRRARSFYLGRTITLGICYFPEVLSVMVTCKLIALQDVLFEQFELFK